MHSYPLIGDQFQALREFLQVLMSIIILQNG